jgi:hypothetical protein
MRARRRTPPTCPRHPGSTVWFDGRYGTATRRRQRYRCLAAGGEPPHRFSEPLPRQSADTDTKGAATPRNFSYTAAEIAAALVAVGDGLSYRGAAARVQGRLRGRSGPDGNSVADWVEVFAPVLFARSAETRWPRVIALDSLRFHIRSLDARGRPIPEATAAFQILGASGSGPTRGSGLVALQAFPGASEGRAQPFWEEFLLSLAGVPEQVVCDPDPDLVAAMESVWTSVPLTFHCHSHLLRQLHDVLRDEGIRPRDPLSSAAERAFDGPGSWREFLESYRPRRLRRLERWIERHDERITWQLEHAKGVDTTTDALEQKLELLRERFFARRGNLRNRERTNRLLMLVQLELNGLADETSYARIIEEDLLLHGGRAGRRRAILDPGGASLRP